MKQRKVPQRMCLGCQIMKPKREMIRIVRTPDNTILIDPTGKKSGRGAYLCPNSECITQAFKAKRLEKALDCPISDEVMEGIRRELP